MRYAEIIRDGDEYPILIRMESTSERNDAAARFVIQNSADCIDGTFIDRTYRQARSLGYDLRRFEIPRYVVKDEILGKTYCGIRRSSDQQEYELDKAERAGIQIVKIDGCYDYDASDILVLKKILDDMTKD